MQPFDHFEPVGTILRCDLLTLGGNSEVASCKSSYNFRVVRKLIRYCNHDSIIILFRFSIV